ncbi:unsaturated chondroitin disaccharide hydrolase [Mucilaginibacter gossypiicola]|uniref:Unsaturated chondroitin disaccharide hydrolase n=1 Tax=Mucilaginibacter gossypiicola TaxID=551995 RepID=A0A1H8LNR7_9SPHI|nr:glycoside hydrolase family 88 protein [Mucilaginibacter gossypiicola]SEO06791.1 unsaturated chondroitin disaccharide hydrolase [Mucilaginibacter gossypiicola]
MNRIVCKYKIVLLLIFICVTGKAAGQQKFWPGKAILYCGTQALQTIAETADTGVNLPRSIASGDKNWRYVGYRDWCSGFWPGILWYLYEATGQPRWKAEAARFTTELSPLSKQPGFDHDLGFQMYSSFGNGYRLTHDQAYKQVLLRSADSLATLFNPRVGTILSWPPMVKKMGWPHNTIIDNMINLELLFWASKNGGGSRLYNIAVKHAETTMRNHFRPDFTSYHVVVYDTVSGKKIKGVTHQGYADSSMWARGQSWAIYGFTMCYRETRKKEFLQFAQKVADVYLARLPADLIPYWDFNAPDIPNAPRDASAAAITASALLELSTFVAHSSKAKTYREKAEQILARLSSSEYQSRDKNPSFLLHSTGHKPNGTEINASIIYADYYYLEALIRLKKLNEKQTKKS